MLPSDSERTDSEILSEAHSTQSQCPSTLDSIWKPSPTATNRITDEKPPISPQSTQSPSESTPLGNKSTEAAASSKTHTHTHTKRHQNTVAGKNQRAPTQVVKCTKQRRARLLTCSGGSKFTSAFGKHQQC